MLKRVTLTGADDSVEPELLIDMSREFPFVEWGILVGSSTGARFPSLNWIRRLVETRDANTRLSLHICGKYLREILAGYSTLLDVYSGFAAFQRCQLNFHGESVGDVGNNIAIAFRVLQPWCPRIIFQFDGVNEALIEPASRDFAVGALFDQSHGAGVLPGEWREAIDGVQCGYAGGIGPDNVVSEIQRIIPKTIQSQPFWIDMETKLFSNGYFSLSRCHSVLSQTREFVTA